MNKADLRDTAVVMFSLMLATLTGFLRQTVIAYTLGVERATDIYLVAYAAPEFVFIALPIVLSPVLLPLFSQVRRQNGERSAWSWGFQLSAWVMMILIGIVLCTALAAPIFLRWLSPGFSPSDRQQAVALLYPMLPGILLMGLSTLAGSFLQIYRRFALPALTTAVYNLVFMAGLLWLPQQDPLNRTGWSVTISACAAFVIQLPLLLRVWWLVHGQAEPSPVVSTNLRVSFQLLGWMVVGYSIHHLILFIDRAMATSLGEGVAAMLNFGYHPALVVGQVSGLAVSFIVFPTLIETVGTKQLDEVRRALRLSLGLVLAIALPVGASLIVLREPLVRLLLEHGAFLSQATAEVSTVLAIYTLAVTLDALCQPLWRLIYASRRGRMVFAVNGVQTIVRLAANLLLVKIIGYEGLAWSAVLGLSVQLLLLGWLARTRFHFTIGAGGWKIAGKILLAALVAGLAAWLVENTMERMLPDFSFIVRLIAGAIVLLVVYGLLTLPIYKQTHWIRSTTGE